MLYVQDGEKAINVYELLEKLFKKSSWLFSTSSTYYDKELTKLQCEAERRGFSDIYEVCSTYFPKVTKEEVAHHLLNTIYTRCFYCNDIHKFVFRRSDSTSFDRFMCGDYPKDYVDTDGYTYEQIENLAQNFKE